jgi:hypothetical protein
MSLRRSARSRALVSGVAPEPAASPTRRVHRHRPGRRPTRRLIDEAANRGVSEDPNASSGTRCGSLAKLKAANAPLTRPGARGITRIARARPGKRFWGLHAVLIGMRASFRVEVSRVSGNAFTNLQVWVRSYIRADVQVARPAFDVLSAGVGAAPRPSGVSRAARASRAKRELRFFFWNRIPSNAE